MDLKGRQRPISAIAAPSFPAHASSADGGRPSSIAKAFQILTAFTEARPRLSLSEIQRFSGLAMTTTHRTVHNLVGLGALQICEDGRYAIGTTLWRLGSLAPATVGLERAAHPYMQALYDGFKHPVQLIVREGECSVFVARCSATSAERNPRVGVGYTMHGAAGGQVLLAYAPRIVQERVLRGPLQRYTRRTQTDPQPLRAILARVRTQGFAVSDRELRDDLVSVAAPIRDDEAQVIGAISLVIPAEEATAHPWPAIVLGATRSVSRTLTRTGGYLPHTA